MVILTLIVFLFGDPNGARPDVKFLTQNFETAAACEAAGKKLVEITDKGVVDSDNDPMVSAEYTCSAVR